MPSATIVTTAGLTALTMSTIEVPTGVTRRCRCSRRCRPAGPPAAGRGMVGRADRGVGATGREEGGGEDGSEDEARADRATRGRGRSDARLRGAKENRSVDSPWAGVAGIGGVAAACGASACEGAGGVTPGGVSGVNNSYIEVPSAETASSCANAGSVGAVEPIVCPVSESSVITPEACVSLAKPYPDRDRAVVQLRFTPATPSRSACP